MNVSELIEELKRWPLDAPVHLWNFSPDEGWWTEEVDSVDQPGPGLEVVLS